jgi:glutamyl-tRNA synthetase
MEDLDASRVRAQAAQTALEDLRWLGLDWDEGPDLGGPSAPYVQSQRGSRYDEVLDRLKASGSVYPCTCTRADIERAATAPHAEDEGPTYPGTCAGRRAADATSLGDCAFAWRFRVPEGTIDWNDLFLGEVELAPQHAGGDFVVARHMGGHSYQLAVVADDAAMGVTQVIRGADLVPSTPRQILLYRRLGWPEPRFGHVPLAVMPGGRRLAKRDASLKLAALRKAGVNPRRLVGAVIQSCGWSREAVTMAPRDAINRFDPALVPAEPWVVSEDWLKSLTDASTEPA